MAKSSSKNIVNACCFWSIVISGIAILLSWIIGWCGAGANIVSIINQIAHIILMVGVVIGGIFYINSVNGKYRILWIVLFCVGVLIGILGICVNFGWINWFNK